MERQAKPIPSLTGLRFIAALLVVISHAVAHCMVFTGPAPAWREYFSSLSGIGMSLFFVLSGFVIDYNYAQPIRERGAQGGMEFFAARFARLYPLYVVFVLIILFQVDYLPSIASGNAEKLAHFHSIFPYYLSLTHTWWYSVRGASSLVYQYPGPIQLTWSISTEWFFYLAYPAICLLLSRVSRPRQLVLAALSLSGAAFVALGLIYLRASSLNAFAIARFGPVADVNSNLQDSFFRWLVYFSPYSRLSEFVLGCITARLFVKLRTRPVEGRETLLERFGAPAALAGLALLHLVMFAPSRPLPFVTFLHMSFGPAPFIAILIFCCARYGGRIAEGLSNPRLVACGEASYSLYLLHIVITEAAQGPHLLQGHPSVIMKSVVTVTMIVLTSIGLSLVTYTLFETPTRRWLRAALAPSSSSSGTSRIGLSSAWACVLLILIGCPLLMWKPIHASNLRELLPQAPRAIHPVEASYGGNCGGAVDNALAFVEQDCAGKESCEFVVDVNRLGDPAGGCSKDFKLSWDCGDQGALRSVTLPPEAGLGTKVMLDCSMPVRPRINDIRVVSATYGASCNAAIDNAKPLMVKACDGKQSCDFVVDVQRLGDPAPGCGKDFAVTWQCGGDAPVRNAYIPAEAGFGKTVTLDCGTRASADSPESKGGAARQL